jgi:hypothetical protein
MADRRNVPQQQAAPVYADRLYQVGVLWSSTSRTSGNRILTGEISLGLMGPRDVLITENNRQDKGDSAPTHFVFIRVPRRGASGNGTGDGPSSDDDDLPFSSDRR